MIGFRLKFFFVCSTEYQQRSAPLNFYSMEMLESSGEFRILAPNKY